MSIRIEGFAEAIARAAREVADRIAEFNDRVVQVHHASPARHRSTGGGGAADGGSAQGGGAIPVVPALYIPPDTSESSEPVPALYTPSANGAGPVFTFADYDPSQPYGPFAPGQPAQPAPPPPNPFANLNDPVAKALRGLLDAIKADKTTDPEAMKVNQIIKAFAEALLWSQEAERLRGIAVGKKAAVGEAERVYGKDSPEYLKALTEWRLAEATAAEAQAKADEAWAQYEVYALDPSYASAMRKAKQRMNGELASTGKAVNLPKPEGTLADAQTRLQTRKEATQKATTAKNEYLAALNALNGLPPDYQPGTERRPATLGVTPESIGNARTQSDQSESDRQYLEALLHITKGNQALADSTVLSLEAEKSRHKQGTLEYVAIDRALGEAKTLQATAKSAVENMQLQFNVVDAQAYLDGLELQKQIIGGQLLADLKARSPHLFKEDGFYNGKNEYSGKLKYYEYEIGNDGQLYVVFHYEKRDLKIQLTYAPGKRHNTSPGREQLDRSWNDLMQDDRLCISNTFNYAQNRLAGAQGALREKAIGDLDKQIPILKQNYDKALADAGGTIPYGPYMPGKEPPVIKAKAELDQAIALRAAYQNQLDWYNFLQTQPLSNLSNSTEEERLSQAFYATNAGERQREFNQYADIYDQPVEWNSGPQLNNGVGIALGFQPTNLAAVQAKENNQDWYSGEQRDKFKDVTDKIREIGGDNARVQVMPIALVTGDGAAYKSALFLVTGKDGMRIVDDKGRDYDNLDHYLEDHQLPGTGTLYMPENLQFTRDAGGNVKIGKVQIEGSDMDKVDTGVALVTTAATILSFTPLAPVAVPIATIGGAYLGVRSGMRIYDMVEHGQTLWSKQGMMEIAMVTTSALPGVSGVTRSVGLFRQGMTGTAATRSGFGAIRATTPYADDARFLLQTNRWQPTFLAANIMDAGGMLVGAPLMYQSGKDLMVHWDDMSAIDRLNSLMGLASGIYGTGRGAHGLYRSYWAGRNNAQPPQRPVTVKFNNQNPQQGGQQGGPSPVIIVQTPGTGSTPPGLHVFNGGGNGFHGAPAGGAPGANPLGIAVPVSSALPDGSLFFHPATSGTGRDGNEASSNSDPRQTAGSAQPVGNGGRAASHLPLSPGDRQQFEVMAADVHGAFLNEAGGQPREFGVAGAVIHVVPRGVMETAYGNSMGGRALPEDAVGFVTYLGAEGQRIFLADTVLLMPVDGQRAVLAHEFAHFYMDPAFVGLTSRLSVASGDPHANLSEGAADYVAKRVLGDGGEEGAAAPLYATEEGIVSQIATSMGHEAFYKAMFHGDADALATFRDLAVSRPEITELSLADSRLDMPGLAGASRRMPPPIKGTGRAADETKQVLRNGIWYNLKTGEAQTIQGTGRAGDETRQVLMDGRWFNLATGKPVAATSALGASPSRPTIPAGHIQGTGRVGDENNFVFRNGKWFNLMTGAPSTPSAPSLASTGTGTPSGSTTVTGAPAATAAGATVPGSSSPVTAPTSTGTGVPSGSTSPTGAPAATAAGATVPGGSTSGPVTVPMSTGTGAPPSSTASTGAPAATAAGAAIPGSSRPTTAPTSTGTPSSTGTPAATAAGAATPGSSGPATVPASTGTSAGSGPTLPNAADYTKAHIFAGRGADGRPVVFIRLGGPGALNPDNPQPASGDRSLNRMERIANAFGRGPRRVVEKNGRYSEKVYEDLYNNATPAQRIGMPEPGKATFDDNTLAIALIPGGLEKIIADIHAHSMGYDRRAGDLFEADGPISLLDKAGTYTRILFGPIPQFCGGDGHYSTPTASVATLQDAQRLDLRLVTDYQRLYTQNPEKAAQGDLSLTGLDFSVAGKQDPIAYAKQMMLEYPGYFNFIGEVTGIKEMVFRQLGPSGWHLHAGSDGYSTDFVRYVDFAAETGQGILLHYDWGEHGVNQAGRPAEKKQAYEHFDDLTALFGQKKYRSVNIVFAHTGIGRFVRPDDAMVTKKHKIYNLKGRRVGSRTITAPVHIHKLYELFAKVPNARADISWNDVTQAYADNPNLRDALIDFIVDNQDRLIFGSDTVKPVNEGQYNQSLSTASPMFARIALRDSDALWKVLRANYEVIMGDAQTRVAAWTDRELRANHRPLSAVDMAQRHNKLDGDRQRLARGAKADFDVWVQRLYDRRDALEGATGEPDFLAKLLGEGNAPRQINILTPTNNALPSGVQFLALPPAGAGLPATTGHAQPTLARPQVPGTAAAIYNGAPPAGSGAQVSLTSPAGRLGERTPGGSNEDVTARHVGAGAVGTGAVVAGGGATFAVDNVFFHDSLSPNKPGSPADDVDAVAFATRGGLISLKAIYGEKIRLDWELIFEQGSVTREGLDRFVGRIFAAKKALNLSDEQLLHIGGLTEQFWANYQFLRDLPVTPESEKIGWSEPQRFNAIMAKVGEYQVSVDRALGTQAAGVNALDPRMPWGRTYNAMTLGTYIVNDYIFVDWALSHGYYYDPTKPVALQIGEMAVMTGFGAANALFTGASAAETGGGVTKVNWSTRAPVKWTRNAGSWVLTVTGGLWASHTGAMAVEQFASGNTTGGVVTSLQAVAEGAFTYFAGRSARNDYGKLRAGDTPSPRDLAKPYILMGGALILTQAFGEIASLFEDEPTPQSLSLKWQDANAALEAYRLAVEANAPVSEVAEKRAAAEGAFNAFRDAYLQELDETGRQSSSGPWFATDPSGAVTARAKEIGFTPQAKDWEDEVLMYLMQDATSFVGNQAAGNSPGSFSRQLPVWPLVM